MQGIGQYLKKTPIDLQKRGPNSEVTDLRLQTAKLLDRTLLHVCGLTRGWNKQELYTMLNGVREAKNPAALWWHKYRETKKIYGKNRPNDKKKALGLGKTGGRKDEEHSGQGILF